MLPPSGGPPPTDTFAPQPPDEPDPIVTFPGLEDAAKRLIDSQVVSPTEYYGMRQWARQSAFTISGRLETRTIERVHGILAENVKEGGDLKAFMRTVEAEIPALPISDAHLENVFRTNTLQAYSAAQDATLQTPIVADAFPYRAYYATADGRTRSSHEHLETSGIGGTNIYLADDPEWDRIRPPNDFNCRCRWIPMTIRQAARKGVPHAQEWLANIETAKQQGFYSGDDGDYRPAGGLVTTKFHASSGFVR
ncbi:MAG: phage minor head protein [Pirellulales bacterium]